jgi:DNA helicase-2/ATP-dependent DNA helicase PcrA
VFDRKEAKDALAFLVAAADPANDAAWLRIVNVPPRGIGEKTVEQLQKTAVDGHTPFSVALGKSDAPPCRAFARGASVCSRKGRADGWRPFLRK